MLLSKKEQAPRFWKIQGELVAEGPGAVPGSPSIQVHCVLGPVLPPAPSPPGTAECVLGDRTPPALPYACLRGTIERAGKIFGTTGKKQQMP